jgi:CDP-glycerol glycerophosphotransferase (TagB/SpsB family)
LNKFDLNTKNNEENDIYVNTYILKEKLKQDIFVQNYTENPTFCVGNFVLFPLSQLDIHIFCICEHKNKITIKGYYTSPCEGFDVALKYGEDLIEPITHISEIIHFRPQYEGKNIFDLKVFEFNFEYKGKDFLQLMLKTAAGRIVSPMVSHTIFSPFTQYIGNKIKICENILIKKMSTDLFYIEDKNIDKFRLNSPHNSDFNYFFEHYKEYQNHRIWIFTDRFLTADDNGFALYNYSKKMNDGIEKYFIIGDPTMLKKKFPDDENILKFDDPKTAMLSIFSEKWISSMPFTDFYRINFHYTPLFYAANNSQFIFLQHGIIKDDVSKIYNGLRYNFAMFVTSAKNEHEFVCSPHFDYPKGVVKLTGLPRLDGRISSDLTKKVITFLPTWRRNLSAKLNLSKDDFISSEFGKIIMDIVTNEKFINALEENEYRFVIKLHPHMAFYSNYLPNTSKNIIYGSNNLSYNEIFSKSCLLITDYSSAVFDFAYAKKPIIYFQKTAPHNENTYFNYHSDGFGDIIIHTDVLIDRLIQIIQAKNLPKMSPKYQKRVDRFFPHIDTCNSERTYNEILKL